MSNRIAKIKNLTTFITSFLFRISHRMRGGISFVWKFLISVYILV